MSDAIASLVSDAIASLGVIKLKSGYDLDPEIRISGSRSGSWDLDPDLGSRPGSWI